MKIYSLGHSNRTLADFFDLLQFHRIEALADVRSYPQSRRQPQFSQKTLKPNLENAGISYRHLPQLGGLRRGENPDSPNDGWASPGLRSFADHMSSPEFARGLDELIFEAKRRPTVFLCAEADPLRCHRQMIADTLSALHSFRVVHILDRNRCQDHRLTPFARVENGTLIYPAAQPPLF